MFSLGQKQTRFKNWSESVCCEPSKWYTPHNLQELIHIVQQANQNRWTLRVVGAGHSFTPLVATGDILVSLEHFQGIDSIDRDNDYVTVWGGSNLKVLGEQLWEQGYAMENLGDINKQSIAGAISTGTHGTGIEFGNLSSQVVGITLVQANGNLLELNETDHPGLFQAAQVSLGMLGIIVKVTLRVLPKYNLVAKSYRVSLETCLEELDQLRESHRNFEFYWFPYTDVVQVKAFDLDDGQTQTTGMQQTMFKKLVIENGLFWVMSEVSRIVPQTAKSVSAISALGVPVGSEMKASHEMYATPRLVKFQEMEYAVPIEKLPNILRMIDDVIRREKYAVHFPLECRFVKSDNIWLSPSYERDSAYIAVHMYKGMKFSPYFRALEEIFKQNEGRPHWGKMHTLNQEELLKRYPKMKDFMIYRKQLDEHGIFMNEYMKSLFM